MKKQAIIREADGEVLDLREEGMFVNLGTLRDGLVAVECDVADLKEARAKASELVRKHQTKKWTTEGGSLESMIAELQARVEALEKRMKQ